MPSMGHLAHPGQDVQDTPTEAEAAAIEAAGTRAAAVTAAVTAAAAVRAAAGTVAARAEPIRGSLVFSEFPYLCVT